MTGTKITATIISMMNIVDILALASLYMFIASFCTWLAFVVVVVVIPFCVVVTVTPVRSTPDMSGKP